MKLEVTENIVLKELDLSDASDIFTTIESQREYLGKWLPFVKSTSMIEDTEAYIKSVINADVERKEWVYVIHYNSVFAGIIGFRDTDKLNHKTELGYWLSFPFQKKGIITNCVKFLVNHRFSSSKTNRIQIRCAEGNVSSKGIPQRVGFKFEGIERDGELLADGKYVNLEVYSLLKSDVTC